MTTAIMGDLKQRSGQGQKTNSGTGIRDEKQGIVMKRYSGTRGLPESPICWFCGLASKGYSGTRGLPESPASVIYNESEKWTRGLGDCPSLAFRSSGLSVRTDSGTARVSSFGSCLSSFEDSSRVASLLRGVSATQPESRGLGNMLCVINMRRERIYLQLVLQRMDRVFNTLQEVCAEAGAARAVHRVP